MLRTAVLLLLAASLSGAPASADTARTERPAATPEQSRPLTEALLHLKVRAALLKNLKIDGLRVKVSAAGSTVTLTGFVKDRATRELAREVASSVEGVERVQSKVQLKNIKDTDEAAALKQLADRTVETQVRTDLAEDLGEYALLLHVEAADGVVTIRGALPDNALRDRAIRTARAAEGAREIKNLVDVRSDAEQRSRNHR